MNDLSLILIAMVGGLLLGLNPVSISIFTSLLASTYGKGSKRQKVATVGLLYIATLGALLMIIGIALSSLFNSLSMHNLQVICLFIACVLVFAGLIYVKNYFWYNNRENVNLTLEAMLHDKITKHSSLLNVMTTAAIAAYATIPSIGLPVVGFVAIATVVTFTTPSILLVYVTALLLPLMAILGFALYGTRLSAIIKWKQDSKAIFKLCIGLVCILLGWILLLGINGSIGGTL